MEPVLQEQSAPVFAGWHGMFPGITAYRMIKVRNFKRMMIRRDGLFACPCGSISSDFNQKVAFNARIRFLPGAVIPDE